MFLNCCRFLGVLFCLQAMLSAQEPEPGGVSGEGEVTLERPASRLRMTIVLTEKAPTVSEALARLKDRREAALSHLTTLKAEKDSIIFSKPAVSEADSGQRGRLETMLQARIARGGTIPKGLQIPKSVTVGCTLTADWRLPAGEEELLAKAKDLEDKIAEADLAGLKEEKKLTPEEAELEEELAALDADSYYDDSQVPPGQPSFVYLAEISEAELDNALKEAFEKAKTKADRLARASGSKLGELVTLRRLESFDASTDYGFFDTEYRATPPSSNTTETESQSPTAASVNFNFRVQAIFRLSKN